MTTNNDYRSDEEEDVEENEDEKPVNYVEELLKEIQRMKMSGVVFTSNNDMPDDSEESRSQGFTLFRSSSRFGR